MSVQLDAARFSIKTDNAVAVPDRDTSRQLQADAVGNYSAKSS
jgi:hypothetical protein